MIPRGKCYRILVVAVMTLWLSSLQGVCAGTPMPWSEAKEVVREAYWMHGEGKAYEDSISLAQAYTELNKWKYLFPTDFVRACYYYGRWLREHEHPVLSMQVLLDATHVRTKDYIILGRVYSNIGTMCHMAKCHDLAYEIFQRSNACFLQAGDTTLYYYGLNNMAFVKAVLADKTASDSILNIIQDNCTNEAVLIKILETKAEACLFAQQYDSTLYYASEFYTKGKHEPLGLMIRAQAFYCLQQYDSAQYYANHIIHNSTDLYELDCSYYILIHCDSVFGNNHVYVLDATRADVHQLMAHRHGQLSQAVQLLQEDIERKPNLGWLYAIVGTILFVSTGLSIYIVNRKRKNALLAQQIKRQKQEHEDLLAQTQSIQQAEAERLAAKQEQIENICHVLRHSPTWRTDMDWEDYDGLCTKMNALFYQLANKLKDKGLNRTEVRVCMLILMQFSESAIAETLPYAKSGVGKLKHTTAKKLGTTISKLRDFLISACL